MIEKIFIPTVNRVDNQIAYNHLPEELKKRVVMVVQAWERSKYDYDCEYLVLPDTSEYHYTDYYCLPKTRRFIYEAGKNIKYCVMDDDIQFGRRNAKYFGDSSNMEKSKRVSNEQDVLEMFELYDKWLDEEEVTVCGCAHIEHPPSNKRYTNNTSLGSVLWINGNDFKDVLSDLDLTSVRVMEDTCFLLSLLTRGYGNRRSEEFIFYNNSILKKQMKSTVWDTQTFEQTHNDHKYLEKLFPEVYTILYDEEGKRLNGGYRDYGKVKVQWSKAYKRAKSKENVTTLDTFFS